MAIILNIGLDGVEPRVNCYGKQLTRAEVALEATKSLNFKVGSHAVVRSDTEETLVATCNHPGDAVACTHWLAEKLGQDCIALFDTEGDQTGLYGPRADGQVLVERQAPYSRGQHGAAIGEGCFRTLPRLRG